MASTTPEPLRVVFLCTGNAARSVMATTMARALDREDLEIRGAGTHSIEGLPMSTRTRTALAELNLADIDHRSHQLTEQDAEWADVIVAFEKLNVLYVRRTFPAAAARTATIRRLDELLSNEAEPFADRITAMNLGTVELAPWEEVIDPAGGDQAVFHACAAEVQSLVVSLLGRITQPAR